MCLGVYYIYMINSVDPFWGLQYVSAVLKIGLRPLLIRPTLTT